jgi:hypothetical protein
VGENELRADVGREARFSPEEIETMKRQRAAVVERFGADFAGDWGWALPVAPEGTRRLTFRDLEQIAERDNFRPDYVEASHIVHGGATGANYVHVQLGDTERIIAGPTNLFLRDPAVLTAYSLVQLAMSTTLHEVGQEHPVHPERLGAVTSLVNLVKDVEREFELAEDRQQTLADRLDAAIASGSRVVLLRHETRNWIDRARVATARSVRVASSIAKQSRRRFRIGPPDSGRPSCAARLQPPCG